MKISRSLARLSLQLGLAAALATPAIAGHGDSDRDRPGVGAVYTFSNDAASNELLVYPRGPRGELGMPAHYTTGGVGTGGGLGNQAGMAMSPDNRHLYLVNAGSDSISVFDLHGNRTELVQVVDSGGQNPISIATHGDLVYVLNTGGAVGGEDNLTVFYAGWDGMLLPIPGSTRALSEANTAAAQVGVSKNGKVVVVTERATNRIDTFLVGDHGQLSDAIVHDSVGVTPFGFAFNNRGVLVVSEAAGGAQDASTASSYGVNDDGSLVPLSQAVPTTESAACWISITANGHFAYSSNTASNSLTGFAISPRSGGLYLLDEDGKTGNTGTGPLDSVILGNRLIYVLDRNGGEIEYFHILADGSLVPGGSVFGVPTTSNGLVVR